MKRELRPLAPFHEMYRKKERALEFDCKDRRDWQRWRKALRRKLTELLGGFPERRPRLSPEILETKEFDGYVRQKVAFRSAPAQDVVAYLLIPSGVELPAPAALAIHGHGYGVKDIVGLWEDGSERSTPDGYHKDFAVELARRGFVTIAPEVYCFGERTEPEDRGGCSCRKAAWWAQMYGKTLIGVRVWDVMRCIDYLETRKEVDADRIGCMGISGGGMVTTFASALEDRIKAVVVSGYICTFKDSILAMNHCECNYVPNILLWAEQYDVASLIAPRPLLVEAGTKDTIFPLPAVRKALSKIRRAYRLLGETDRLDSDVFEGRHQISGAKAYDWLRRWLCE